MRTQSPNKVSQAFSADGKGPMVYGRYRDRGYKVNPLTAKAGGVAIEGPVSPREAFQQAGLDWKVQVDPAVAIMPDGRQVTSKRYRHIVHPVTGEILGVHGTKYHPIDHTSFIPVFDYHREDLKIESILSINGGAKVYITASFNSEAEVVPGDTIRQYLHLYNSHDGSQGYGGFFTTDRLWCANQLNGFLREGGRAARGGYGFRVKHTKSLKEFAELLPEAIDLSRRTFTTDLEQLRAMSRTKLTTDLARNILERTFASRLTKPVTDKETGETRPRTLNDLPEIGIIRDFAYGDTGYGMDLPGVRGTVYGLFNAITQYETHAAGRGSETERARARLESLWNGQGGHRIGVAREACLAATR